MCCYLHVCVCCFYDRVSGKIGAWCWQGLGKVLVGCRKKRPTARHDQSRQSISVTFGFKLPTPVPTRPRPPPLLERAPLAVYPPPPPPKRIVRVFHKVREGAVVDEVRQSESEIMRYNSTQPRGHACWRVTTSVVNGYSHALAGVHSK